MTQKSQKEGQIKIVCLVCKELCEDLKDNICTKCLQAGLILHSQPQIIKVQIPADEVTKQMPVKFQTKRTGSPQRLQKGKRRLSQITEIKEMDPCRCGNCRKKTGMLGFICNHCLVNFCRLHRLPEDHSCEVDFVTEGRKKLKMDNPLIQSFKIQHI